MGHFCTRAIKQSEYLKLNRMWRQMKRRATAKRGFDARVENGDRFVERIPSLGQTCRLQGKRTFPIFVEAMEAFMQGKKPDVIWRPLQEPAAAVTREGGLALWGGAA